MPRNSLTRVSGAAVMIAAFGSFAAPSLAQNYAAPGHSAPYAEDTSTRLLRHMRVLATSPKNFAALIGAGEASLELGDTQAAAGFFGRAEEVSPRSPLPQAGMGSALVAMGDPRGALTYFARAQQYGALHAAIAPDRGLAFDLIGDQAKAQSDYRAVLNGPRGNDARRRLALSLAISGDQHGARETMAPLMARGDAEARRINAFVLALAGDPDGARRAIDSAMPGAGLRFDPYFRILPVLRAEEKAAAVHLGEFPRDAAVRYANARPIPTSPTVTLGGSRQTIISLPKPAQRAASASQQRTPPPKPVTRTASNAERVREPFFSSMDPARFRSSNVRRPKTETAKPNQAEGAPADPEPRPGDRLEDIAQLLSVPQNDPAPAPAIDIQLASAEAPPAPLTSYEPPAPPPPPEPRVEGPAKPAKAVAARPSPAQKLAAEMKAREAAAAKLGVQGTNWVQLAGGSNQDRMGVEYRKLSAKAGSLLKSRSGYVTGGKVYFRLLVGPFASKAEAQAFVNKLEKTGVDGFSWTRNPAQIRIEKLKT